MSSGLIFACLQKFHIRSRQTLIHNISVQESSTVVSLAIPILLCALEWARECLVAFSNGDLERAQQM